MNESLWTFAFELANFVALAALLSWLFFKPVRKAVEHQRARTQRIEQNAEQKLAEAENLPPHDRERLIPKLRTVTMAVVSQNPDEWGTYCAPPLKIAPTPQSIVADLLEPALQTHLDYQIVHQSLEGTWEPVWTWGDIYPKAWAQARNEWRGHLTLETLTSLRAFGRIVE